MVVSLPHCTWRSGPERYLGCGLGGVAAVQRLVAVRQGGQGRGAPSASRAINTIKGEGGRGRVLLYANKKLQLELKYCKKLLVCAIG